MVKLALLNSIKSSQPEDFEEPISDRGTEDYGSNKPREYLYF